MKNRDKITKLITHENCADGVASALIIKAAIPNIKIDFIAPGTFEHKSLKPEPGLLFCDISPVKETAKDFLEIGSLVLDHHHHQKDITELFENNSQGKFANLAELPGVSGAMLAYSYVYIPIMGPNPDVEKFAMLAGIHDTWQTNNSHWKIANEQVESLLFWPIEKLLTISTPWDGWHSWVFDVGGTLYQKRLENAKRAVEEQMEYTSVRGTKVGMFQDMPKSIGVSLTNEAEEFSSADITVGYNSVIDSKTKQLILMFSLRSKNGYDVGALCKFYGGGGHVLAAGMSVPYTITDNPYSIFFDMLEKYEQTVKRT